MLGLPVVAISTVNDRRNAEALQFMATAVATADLSAAGIIVVNGIFETVIGLMLLAGVFVRFSAALLALHLLGIMVTLGYNDVMIRDFGIFIALISTVLHGEDNLSLTRLRMR